MRSFCFVTFILLSPCLSVVHSTPPAVREVGVAGNDTSKPPIIESFRPSLVISYSRLGGLPGKAADGRETINHASFPSAFADATVTGDHRRGSSVRPIKSRENEEKQEDTPSVKRTQQVSLPTDNIESVRGNVQTVPFSSPPPSEKQEEEEDRDADLVRKGDEVEGDDVEDDDLPDKHTATEEARGKLLYSLTKSNAPTAWGLVPGVLMGAYTLYLFYMKRYSRDAVRRSVLREYPNTPERYLDVMLHPATPFAIGGASAALLANYAYTRHKAKTYERLMRRSFTDKDVSTDERQKALNELLLIRRDQNEQPPINGIGGLVAATIPFLAEKAGLLTIFDQTLGVTKEKQGRLSLGAKVAAGALAVFSAYRLGESLWRRRKYHQKIKELSAKKQLTAYTEKTMRLLMTEKKMKTAFTDVGQQVKENTTETGREEQREKTSTEGGDAERDE